MLCLGGRQMPKKVVTGKSRRNIQTAHSYGIACQEHSGLQASLVNIVRWQRKQNGDVRELQKDVGKLHGKVHESRMASKEEIGGIRKWIIATLVSVMLLLITALLACVPVIARNLQ